MTEFEKIIAAIKPFGFPHAPDIYEGSEECFFVYNYADEWANFYADNAPAAVLASVQVHLYIPAEENFIELKNKVRRALHQQGFPYPEVTVLREAKKRHLVFECDIEEELEE